MSNTHFISWFFAAVGVFFCIVVFCGMYQLKNKDRTPETNAEQGTNNLPTRSAPTQTPTAHTNTSTNTNTQNDSFNIPSQHSDKVFLDPESHFHFKKSCTLQPKKYFGETIYFEIMFFEFPKTTLFFAGLSPLNFPYNSVPGLFESTIALETRQGELYKDGIELDWPSIGKFSQGDVLSIAIRTSSSPTHLNYTINFAKNGNYGQPTTYSSDCFLIPTIHATASCSISANFGHTDFIYDHDGAFIAPILPTPTPSTSTSSPPVTKGDVLPSYDSVV